MKRIINKVYSFIAFIILGLFVFPNVVNAEKYSSDFIKIDDVSYNYVGEDFSLSEVYFSKSTLNTEGLTSYGVLFGKMINTSGYYLSAYMTIDYYDTNYKIVARSTKTESPRLAKDNYQMNIILYDNDFLGNYKIDDIAYFKINYYTVKGNPLTEENLSQNNQYSSYDYVINKYNIDIVVNENNTLNITEKIGAYFNTYKHGIFRKIPLKNKVTRLDGTTSNNRVKISNINVDDNYSLSNEGIYKVIKIGNPDYTVTGQKNYTISYLYNLGKDTGKGYDELYFNLIGDEWDTKISNITFTITMPKEFDKSKLGFSSGTIGSTNSSNIDYDLDGNVIIGKLNGTLNPGEALTVRLELPEGYFVGASNNLDLMMIISIVIPILFLLIGYLIWKKYGKDDIVVETVEFYPPSGCNSLDVGFLYKGKAVERDVISLLVYLANKGYIKISDYEEKSLFSTSHGFKITKLKEYHGNDINERMFLRGLFTKKPKDSIFEIDNEVYYNNKIDEVTSSDLRDNFYVTTNAILTNINSEDNKNKILEKSASDKKIFIILMAIIIYCLISIPPLIQYGELEIIWAALLFPGIGFTIMFTLLLGGTRTTYVNGKPTYSSIITKLFGLFVGGMWVGMSLKFMVLPSLLQDYIYLVIYIIGMLCILGLAICLKYLPKRTPYGNEILGKLKGFKNFLETAEKDKLEAMVMQNPTYFYDILPYTYVLGVSDKWIKKFETISLQAPSWCDSPSSFNIMTFGTFMNSTMTSAQKSMSQSSSSSGSSGGGFSGGGSSGGGSGGGGGGSW